MALLPGINDVVLPLHPDDECLLFTLPVDILATALAPRLSFGEAMRFYTGTCKLLAQHYAPSAMAALCQTVRIAINPGPRNVRYQLLKRRFPTLECHVEVAIGTETAKRLLQNPASLLPQWAYAPPSRILFTDVTLSDMEQVLLLFVVRGFPVRHIRIDRTPKYSGFDIAGDSTTPPGTKHAFPGIRSVKICRHRDYLISWDRLREMFPSATLIQKRCTHIGMHTLGSPGSVVPNHIRRLDLCGEQRMLFDLDEDTLGRLMTTVCEVRVRTDLAADTVPALRVLSHVHPRTPVHHVTGHCAGKLQCFLHTAIAARVTHLSTRILLQPAGKLEIL
jgi:hypothetical protein